MKIAPRPLRLSFTLVLAALLGAPLLRAANGPDTWSGAASSGNTELWSSASNWFTGNSTSTNAPPSTGDSLIFNGTTNLTNNDDLGAAFGVAGITFGTNAGAYVLSTNGTNTISLTAGITDDSTNLETINIPLVFNSNHSFAIAPGGSMTVGSVMSGGNDGLTLNGALGGSGTLTLTAANTITGCTTVNAGTVKLDFTASGAPSSNIIASTSPLFLGGGTLNLVGSSSSSSSQTFASTAFNAGASVINAAPVSGTNYPTLTLKAFTVATGAAIQFNGPATINGSGSVAATATITTTTQGNVTGPVEDGVLMGSGNNTYATVGLYDWASTNITSTNAGTTPYTITGGSQVTGFYAADVNNTSPTANSNWDISAQQTPGGYGNDTGTVARDSTTGTVSLSTIRFNSGHAPYIIVKSTENLDTGGILITPNMGEVNSVIDGVRLSASTIQIVQNDNSAVFITGNNTSEGAFFSSANSYAETVVKSGTGSWFIDPTSNNFAVTYLNSGGTLTTNSSATWNYSNVASASYYALYLDGGVAVINNANVLGNPTTANTTAGGGGSVNLNGGTLMSDIASLSLVNAAASNAARYVFLGTNGGGLAAATGTTMTVSGVIAGASGTGALTIGIPASAANGQVLGQVPGTGTGTSYTTPNTQILATGTVQLTGTNTYTGGTIVDSGTLNFGSNSLGSGGVTLNGGTLQWGTSTTTDITAGNLVTVSSGGGTLDTNSQNVTLGTSNITGSGALATKSGTGVLTISASNPSYSGTLTVTSGTLSVTNSSGSATGTNGVTVNTGTNLEGTGHITGTVTANGNITPGVASAVGTLTVGGLTTSSSTNLVFNFSSGTSYSSIASGGTLTLSGGTFYLYTAGTTAGWNTLGLYNLIGYGSIGGTAPTQSSVANPQAGLTYTFGESGSFLTLDITGVLANGIWDIAGSSNWGNSSAWSNSIIPDNGNVSVTPPILVQFGSAITGPATVTLDASHTVGGLYFVNSNSYTLANSGGSILTLDNGSSTPGNITVGAGSHTVSAPINISGNGGQGLSVTTAASTTLTLSGAIGLSGSATGTPGVTYAGSGKVVVSNTNTYTGATTISGGTVNFTSLNNFGSSGSLVLNGGTLQWATSTSTDISTDTVDLASGGGTFDTNGNNVTLANAIGDSDTGSLTKAGSGVLTLSGTNTYSGATNINGGTVNFTALSNLGTGSSITLNGGTLQWGGTADITGGTRTVVLNSGGGTFDLQSNNVNLANGNITGTGSLTKIGSGTLTLGNATNTYSGGTIIDAGTVQVSADGDLGGTSGGIALANGSTLELTSSFTLNSSRTITLTSSNSITADTGATVGFAGNVQNGASAGALNFTGPGQLNLTGTNSYTGGTTVNSGTLEFGSVPTTGTITLDGTSNLTVNNATSVPSLTVNGNSIFTGNGGSGTGVATLNGAGTLTVDVSGGGVFDLTGTITGFTGTLTMGSSSTLRFNGSGGTGTAIFNLGTATATAAVRSSNTGITLGGLAGGSGTFLEGAGGGTGGQAVTYTIGGANTSTEFDGTIENAGSNVTAITKTGTANLTLTGTNTYSGGTTVSQGTLNFTASALGSGAVTVSGGSLQWASGNTQDISGVTITLGTGTDTLDTQANNVNLANAIGNSGAGNLVKAGSGTLTLSNGATNTGSTTVSAGTLVVDGSLASTFINPAGGELEVGSSNLLPSSATLFITGGGVFGLGSFDQTLANVTLGNTSAAGSITGTGTLTVNAPGAYDLINGTVSANLAGDGSFSTTGAVTLTGTNSFTSNVSVGSNSTVTVSNLNSLGNGANLSLAANAGLNYSGANANLTQNITVTSGNGTVTNSGGNTLTLSGTLVKNGSFLTLNGGTFIVTGNIIGPSAHSDFVVNGSTVTLDGSNNTYNGTTYVYGGGTLINGIANAIPADSILSLGNSTSGGTYDLNGFDQTIDALATAGSSTNIVTNNGSGSGTNLLTLAGPDSGIFGGTIQDGSTAHIALTIAGATETLSGANTYTGATIVSSGTLIADNSSAFNTQGVTLGDANTTANNASPTLLTGGSVNVGNAITVANQSTSGTYTIGGGTDNLSTFSGTISINQPLTISQVATTALHALVISGGISSANGAQTVTFDNTGAVRVQTTAITDGTGSISVLQDGSGTTSFNVANSYSGTTTVSAGTLQAGATGAFNTQSVTLGDANTHTNNSSPALLTNGAVTIGNAITVANESTSGTYTVGGGTDNNSSFTGAISINQPLTVSQVATTGGHTLTVSGGVSSANGAQTLTFANAGNVSITTTALADGSGTLNVAQSGAGTTSFSIANPYSGTTDIYAGTLALIGSGSLGSGAVTLGVDGVSSGTLDLSGASGNVTLAQAVSGNGTFATGSNTLNVNASLSPGFGGSAGLVTVTGTGGVNFGSSSTLNFKINSATVSDQISLGAGSNLNFTSGSVIALATNYSPAPYTTITLVSLNGGSTITGITDFTGTTFSGGYWDTSVFGETGQIEAVPEPAAFGLLLGALALLAARRRRA